LLPGQLLKPVWPICRLSRTSASSAWRWFCR